MRFKTMNKAEQLKQQQKEVEAKTLSETLLKLSEQHNSLQAKINPLGKVLENITATQKAFQLKSPFAELAKNPLLKQIAAIQNNPIITLAKQQQKLYDSLQGSHWTETILKINSILPKYDLPMWDLPNYKPLYEYGLQLQKIQIRFTTPEIVKSFQSMQDLANNISEAKAEAENNFWHNITVEDYEFEKEKDKEKNTKLKQQIIELERSNNNYLITIKTLSRLVSTQPKAQTKKELSRTLHPNITQSQIARLCENLKGIFEATPEQWRALFSETEIKLSKPIKAFAPSDIGILLYHLKERNLIENTKYPSVIERTKAFSINGIPIISKQINDLKTNMNFPTIGKNYSKISKAVASM
jgi:hypothetical protein